MTGSTHLAAGTAIGLFITTKYNLPISDSIAVLTCTAAGSLIPDIDSMTSKLGRRLGPTSVLIQLIIGHRTLFHAPLMYLLLCALVAWTYPATAQPVLALAAGIGSHLFLDMFNSAGIPLLWPLRHRFSLGRIRTRGIMDRLLCLALITISVLIILTGF